MGMYGMTGREKGTDYRSWGEAQLARFFESSGVSYFYEHPLALVEGGKTRLWYPDFRLADNGILVEYCGMVGKPDYDAGVEKKRAAYRENGYAALMLTPDYFRGNWPQKLRGEIEGTLQGRLDSFRGLRSHGYDGRRRQ